MSLYLCKEEMTENGGYLVPIRELIQCKDCKYWLKNQDYYEEGSRFFSALDTCQKLDGLNDATAIDYCSRAERKMSESRD